MASSHAISNQFAMDLPEVSAFYTTHDGNGRAIFVNPPPDPCTKWHNPIDNEQQFFSLFATSKVTAKTIDDMEDFILMSSENPRGPPLVVQNGTCCRMVDFSPDKTSVAHQTVSVDCGVVIQGTIELLLDSGEKRLISPGGMIVQRGTMHTWRNPSATEWTRMFFALIAAEPRVVARKSLEEGLGGF